MDSAIIQSYIIHPYCRRERNRSVVLNTKSQKPFIIHTREPLEIEHGLLHPAGHAISPHLLAFTIYFNFATLASGSGTAVRNALEQRVQVTPATFTSKVGVIGRRNQTDRLRCTSEHVADVICKALQLVCCEANLIVNDVVVVFSV
ncbi:unnamed protein product [Somion occarium]|uniref:Uncharacterized protein n=1 Tax=Somion occarium TaxID=3059160 RepID=A0ABP1DP44_9APHY